MSPTFRQRVRQALQTNRLNSRNLSAFAMGIEAYLSQTDPFSKINYKKTADPFCALLVRCVVAEPSTPPATVRSTLERVWLEAPLGYDPTTDLYEFEQDQHFVQMRFLAVASYGAVVTGCIDVSGWSTQFTSVQNSQRAI